MKKRLGSEIGTKVTPFVAYTKIKEQKIHTLTVTGTIESAEDFLEHCYLIDQAEEGDIIYIKLNSCGGSLAAVDYLLHALNKTEAVVHVECTGECSSAATLILLSADSFEISNQCEILIHNAMWGVGGKHADILDYVRFNEKQVLKLLHDYYDGMFTEQEFEQLVAGKQFYMTGETFIEKFERRQEWLDQKCLAEQEAAEAALQEKPVKKPRKKSVEKEAQQFKDDNL